MESSFPKFLSEVGCNGHCVSSMSPHEFLGGRPYGGVALLWKHCLNIAVTPIVSNCNELCIAKVKWGKYCFGLQSLHAL